MGPPRIERVFVVPEELGITIGCIDLENAEVTNICSNDIRCSLLNVHCVIILTTIKCCAVVCSVMSIQNTRSRTQLIPRVSLPDIQLSIVPVTVQHTKVNIAPYCLRQRFQSLEAFKIA